MTDEQTIEWLNGIEDHMEMMKAWGDLAKKDRDLIIRINKEVQPRIAAAVTSQQWLEERKRRETELAIAQSVAERGLSEDELRLVLQINSCGDHVVVVKWAHKMVHDNRELYNKIFPAIRNRYFQAVDSDEWKRCIAAGANLGDT